jgi:hypothetical protein
VSNNRSRVEVARDDVPGDAPLPLRIARVPLHDRWLLAIASATAISVTGLQRIPEAFPGGYQVGVFVSSVGFAYVGAWVFNWVIIERPRAQQLRDIYRISWTALRVAARDGHHLIEELAWLADVDELKEPAEYDVEELCRKFPFGVRAGGVDCVASPNNRLDIRNSRLESVALYLAHAEHHVLTALAEVNATDHVILHPIEDRSDDGEPSMVFVAKGKPGRYFTFGDVGNQSKRDGVEGRGGVAIPLGVGAHRGDRASQG